MEMTVIISNTKFTDDLAEANKDKKTNALKMSLLYVLYVFFHKKIIFSTELQFF